MQRGWRWAKPPSSSPSLTTRSIVPLWQIIGQLAQAGVYEFHRDPLLLKSKRGVEIVADRLYLYYQPLPVRSRVTQILESYHDHPLLLDLEILLLNRGDEPTPPPIAMRVGQIEFDLFTAFDCIVRRATGGLEIIEFKTGESEFDRRQAYTYLLAASYLYRDRPLTATAINLETGAQSELITATPAKLAATEKKLARIAHLHHHQIQAYRSQPSQFDRLFPANPGPHCHACQFDYICHYSGS
jgi:hypothetical protein